MKINLKNIAFTMAEMMMVMAIIGATAALTIPNLVDSYKEEQTIVKLKKVQEDLNRAYKSAILKYGEYDTWSSLTSAQKISKLTEFLKGMPCEPTTCWPNDLVTMVSGTKYELEDGTTLSIRFLTGGYYQVLVAPFGAKSNANFGQGIFGFFLDPIENASHTCTAGSNLTRSISTFYPQGYCEDRNISTNAFTGSGLSTSNWAVFNGNLDYLKCNDLN